MLGYNVLDLERVIFDGDIHYGPLFMTTILFHLPPFRTSMSLRNDRRRAILRLRIGASACIEAINPSAASASGIVLNITLLI